MNSQPRGDSTRISLARKIKAELLKDIELGRYGTGQRIPTERELCRTFGASRVTVRSALSELVHEGLLLRKAGSGSFVRDRVEKTGTVAFLRCQHGSPPREIRMDFIYSEVLEGIQAELENHAIHVLFSYIREDASEFEKSLVQIGQKASGLILGEMRSEECCRRLVELGTPFVLVNPEFPRATANSVDYDNFSGALKAVEHLIGLGHRTIAYINGRATTRHATERLAAYRTALENYGIPFRQDLVLGNTSWQTETGYAAVQEMLRGGAGASAVFAANDALAVGALNALHDAGMRVPRDVSVIGFDDMILAAHASPPLTTMRVDRIAMGRLAAARLLQLIGTPGIPPVRSLFVPELVERKSCGPVRVRGIADMPVAQPERG